MSTTDVAIILAAGFGTRLDPDEGHKILARVAGTPLIDYHLRNFDRVGVEEVIVVTGHEHEALETRLGDWETPADMRVRSVFNPEFSLSNGVSTLTGAAGLERPFWLVMSDHIFEPAMFDRLSDAAFAFEDADDVEGMLAVDYKIDQIYDVPDANKVRFDGKDLDAIGKKLDSFDCVDAGLFWCGRGFVDALRDEREARGDCSTSDAVVRLAREDEFLFWDVGECLWQDVDTPGARRHAEGLVARWREPVE